MRLLHSFLDSRPFSSGSYFCLAVTNFRRPSTVGAGAVGLMMRFPSLSNQKRFCRGAFCARRSRGPVGAPGTVDHLLAVMAEAADAELAVPVEADLLLTCAAGGMAEAPLVAEYLLAAMAEGADVEPLVPEDANLELASGGFVAGPFAAIFTRVSKLLDLPGVAMGGIGAATWLAVEIGAVGGESVAFDCAGLSLISDAFGSVVFVASVTRGKFPVREFCIAPLAIVAECLGVESCAPDTDAVASLSSVAQAERRRLPEDGSALVPQLPPVDAPSVPESS
jgi:hypothetical protein